MAPLSLCDSLRYIHGAGAKSEYPAFLIYVSSAGNQCMQCMAQRGKNDLACKAWSTRYNLAASVHIHLENCPARLLAHAHACLLPACPAHQPTFDRQGCPPATSMPPARYTRFQSQKRCVGACDAQSPCACAPLLPSALAAPTGRIRHGERD